MKLYGIESYIAVPLTRRDGTYFGTLCALDPLPAELDEQAFDVFNLLASLIAFELEAEDNERRSHETAQRLLEQSRALAQLEERDRIAMDLHDGVIQSLYGVVLALGATAGDQESEQTKIVEDSITRLNGVIQDIRNNIFDLRVNDLASDGLKAGIERVAEELRINTLMDPDLELAEDLDGLLDADATRSLLYIAREATANVIRHARATSVWIRLRGNSSHIELSIRDNGHGFDVRRRGNGNGLTNIRQRALQLGGQATVSSGRQRGTEVLVRVPVQSALRAESSQ